MAATAAAAVPDTDLTKLEWHFPEWLAQFGPLNPVNVLDYFEHSPFWDPTCNNAVLKMQTQYNALEALQEHLRQMTGVEFAVVHERWPALFVIRKQNRRSPTEVLPLTVYHVVHGRIYQSPDMLTLLNTRMLTSLHHLETAMHRARELVEFQPSSGYSWRTNEAAQAEQERSTRQEMSAVNLARQQESHQFRMNVDRLMAVLATNGVQAAMSKTPGGQSSGGADSSRRKKKGDDASVSSRKKKKLSQQQSM
ncbi:MED6 mediator sub complex component-domain-containing protein [Thamnocephalis sphaerospora]|uniref:Mediator of RNA polymerase II transcription subunit 6 n=1 Tax=Thamnocephalis sphaerospora TaxID=78915 RepID=A0A4P9XHC7_9FUNG|nr:MED6 mediator sub complex component-domain-containing protein [Thamnocephalis sphaerospora]|eukprot:RKP05067.1 MED6 mediator sub complex component-domain-containing protein [Thamnocephalis sphaerospora]